MQPALLIVCLLGVALASSGCQSTRDPNLYLAHWDVKEPEVDDFELCASSGCRQISRLGYSEHEWQRVISLFTPAPESASEERERLNIAIGLMEQINGPKNGSSGDALRNRRELGTGSQLDCIAEAANTTVALLLLEKEGYLRFHRVGYPQHRGFIQLRLPHNTASVHELASDRHYVIDSWFYANGEPAVSVPVEEWKAGFDPED